MCLFGPVDICVALLCCSFATLMVYKIPMGDVKSLAKAFSQLESGEWPENSIECLVYWNFGNFVFKDTPPPHSLSAAKQNFNFEEYNFSQSTLEQVGRNAQCCNKPQ